MLETEHFLILKHYSLQIHAVTQGAFLFNNQREYPHHSPRVQN